jgi:glycosyltransferase involved in cell wall biosynthesis
MAVHVHGLFYPLQMRLLRNMLPNDSVLVAQHHAEKPWEGLRSPVQRWGLRTADGFFFAARDLANCWIDRGLISEKQGIFQVMEGSTDFRCQERAVARARTGLTGTPIVLWVGNLTTNKDPLTVLAGFEQILQQIPKARLYMAYRGTDLLDAVRARIASSSTLCGAVTLLGSVAHSHLEDIYNSVDYFVLGSHYEGSGFALAEAMACGVVPVVTDIPSFRAMTGGGSIGGCWTVGHGSSFANLFLEVFQKPIKALSARAVQHFDRHLSYPAIAQAAMQAYRELISRRTGQSL